MPSPGAEKACGWRKLSGRDQRQTEEGKGEKAEAGSIQKADMTGVTWRGVTGGEKAISRAQ